jgi:hypothetical protein
MRQRNNAKDGGDGAQTPDLRPTSQARCNVDIMQIPDIGSTCGSGVVHGRSRPAIKM